MELGDDALKRLTTDGARTLRMHVARAAPWILKFAVSVFLIWFLVGKLDGEAILREVRRISAAALAIAFALILVQCVIGAIRWLVVIRAIGAQLRIGKAIEITFVGLFFNQFLPASVGSDIVRMWQSTRAGLAMPTAVTSVMLERFGNLLTIFGMALIAMPILTTHANLGDSRYVIVVIFAGSVATLAMVLNLDRLPARWRDARIVRGAARLARDARALFLSPRSAIQLVATGVLGQMTLATAVWVLADGLGINVRLVDCIVLMPPVALVSALPISVAGWGVREMAMVTAFGMLSVPSESALALSVILALLATAASLPGGLLWLIARKAKAEVQDPPKGGSLPGPP